MDVSKFKNNHISKEEICSLRLTAGVSPKDIWLLSVGELNDNKNHETVIKAIAGLKQSNIFYSIVGEGPKRKYLEELILKLDLSDRIKLLGFRDDVKDLYKAADIYIHPSFREGLSVATMEAMASGLPVITGNIRGNVDLIDNNGGFLFNPSSIQGCSSVISFMIEKNENERLQMGLYNQKKIKKFDKENISKLMRDIYGLFS